MFLKAVVGLQSREILRFLQSTYQREGLSLKFEGYDPHPARIRLNLKDSDMHDVGFIQHHHRTVS